MLRDIVKVIREALEIQKPILETTLELIEENPIVAVVLLIELQQLDAIIEPLLLRGS